MKQLLKFLFLYDPDSFRSENPKGSFLVAVIAWMVFCGLIFYHAKDLGPGGRILFAVMSLWLFIRLVFYQGQYRPRIVYALKIAWLPMVFLYLVLTLTGNL